MVKRVDELDNRGGVPCLELRVVARQQAHRKAFMGKFHKSCRKSFVG